MLLIVLKFSFPKRDMSESYLLKGVLHLSQLPLEQHIEEIHIERLPCHTAAGHDLNSLEALPLPGGSPHFPKTVLNIPCFPVNSGFSLTLGQSNQSM